MSAYKAPLGEMRFVLRDLLGTEALFARLGRESTLRESINHARFFVVESLQAAFELSNAYAPEHLIVQVAKGDQTVPNPTSSTVIRANWLPWLRCTVIA